MPDFAPSQIPLKILAASLPKRSPLPPICRLPRGNRDCSPCELPMWCQFHPKPIPSPATYSSHTSFPICRPLTCQIPRVRPVRSPAAIHQAISPASTRHSSSRPMPQQSMVRHCQVKRGSSKAHSGQAKHGAAQKCRQGLKDEEKEDQHVSCFVRVLPAKSTKHRLTVFLLLDKAYRSCAARRGILLHLASVH